MGMNKRVVSVVVTALVMIVGWPAAAFAVVDNMVPTYYYDVLCVNSTQANPGHVCQTDNYNLVVYTQSSVSSTSHDAVELTLSNSYEGTDLTTGFTTSPIYSGGSETDVIYQQGNTGFSGNQLGYTWCDDAVDGTNYSCDQQYTKFRYDADRALACHETGHAVGLTHGDKANPYTSNTNGDILGCMVTPVNYTYRFLGANNVDNINFTY